MCSNAAAAIPDLCLNRYSEGSSSLTWSGQNRDLEIKTGLSIRCNFFRETTHKELE